MVWRVVSVDTHPTEGSFQVPGGTLDAASLCRGRHAVHVGALALPVRADDCRRAPGGNGGFCACSLLARVWIRAARWPRLVWASWTALLVAGVLLLGLTVAEMSGEPLAQVLTNGSVAQVLGGTRFGAVWRLADGHAGGLARRAVGSEQRPAIKGGSRPLVVLEAAESCFWTLACSSVSFWPGTRKLPTKAPGCCR